jgi:glycosyltransferase involved in cell wall biosynthesis
MGKMHVTFLLNQELEGASSLGRHVPLAKELVKLGYRVRLLATHPAFDSLTGCHFWRDEIEVCYVGQMHVRRSGNRKTYLTQSELLKIAIVSTWRMFLMATRVPTDAFQICKAQPINGLAALMARCLHWKPVFLDSDDYEAEFNYFSAHWQRVVVGGFERTLPRAARGVTTHTRFNVERNMSYGVPAERVLYVPNGIDRERFARVTEQDARSLRAKLGLDDYKVVVYVGNLSLSNHPIDLLLSAFAQVHRQERGTRLLLVGGGEDYDDIQMRVAEMGLTDSVHFTGRLAPEYIPAHLKLADVSVEPVLDDFVARARSPLKVFESMAVGTPVVAGDVGDRRAILGEAGILVPPADAGAMAEGLLTVLQNPGIGRHMAEAAMARRERYYWDVLVHDFEKVYRL